MAVMSMEKWNVAKSAETYLIDAWGAGYFGISSHGNLAVYPERNQARSIDLYQLIDSLVKRGIEVPSSCMPYIW